MSDSSVNKSRLIELAYIRSTATLQAQASIATASDQRALVFSTLCVASAALVYSALNQPSGSRAAIGSAVLFCFAALLSTTAALPGKLHGFPSKHSELKGSIQQDVRFENVLLGLCTNNDEYLKDNEKEAKWRAHFYRYAVFVFLIGVFWSLISFIFVQAGVPK